MSAPPEVSPEELELRRITPIVLRGGLLLAMICVGLGLLRYVMHPAEFGEQWRLLVSGARTPPPFVWDAELRAAAHLEPRGLVLVGLAFLTATPLVRVGLCLVAFVRARNRTFVVLTTVVMVLLITAILLGKIG